MTTPAMIGLPWKREVDSECAIQITDWILKHPGAGISVGKQGVIGNLVWVGRSALIHQAKEVQKKMPDLIHVQLDSDAYPVTPPAEAYRIVQERFDQGVGIVIAPVHSLSKDERGAPIFVKEWNEHSLGGKDSHGFRVRSGSFTWMFIAPLLLRKLRPDGEWTPINSPPIPIYTWTDREHTEDVRLIKRAEELDFETWADTRLICGHGKGFIVPGYGLLSDEVTL